MELPVCQRNTMGSTHDVRRLVLCGVMLASSTLIAAAASWSRADADAFNTKLIQIGTNGLAEKPAARRVTVLEREVNAYLNVTAKRDLPPGVLDPVIRILPDGKLNGRATVDLDAVRNQKERGMLSPWALVRGTVPVEAVGTLRTQNGVGAFTLETATIGGIPVPKTVLQEVVSYYSRSESQPNGVDFEAPFRLPARIREIQTRQGQALVVQ
jgi:hypothetical protein